MNVDIRTEKRVVFTLKKEDLIDVHGDRVSRLNKSWVVYRGKFGEADAVWIATAVFKSDQADKLVAALYQKGYHALPVAIDIDLSDYLFSLSEQKMGMPV